MPLTNKQYIEQGCCPFCKHGDISGEESFSEGDYHFQRIVCTGCKSEWHDIYALVGYDHPSNHDRPLFTHDASEESIAGWSLADVYEVMEDKEIPIEDPDTVAKRVFARMEEKWDSSVEGWMLIDLFIDEVIKEME